MANPLNPLRFPLYGERLIEASAGTGKTYLSAFDVMKLRPRRFLFVVHRELIVKSARASYVKVGVDPADTGLLTGHDKDVDKPYLFATIQTLSRDDILYSFAPDAFDYIDGMLMNPSAADRLIDNAWKQFRSLDIFPQRFPIVTDPMLAGWKIRFFPVQNYLVFYQIEEPAQVVHILRFLYGKSNWVSILKTDFSAE